MNYLSPFSWIEAVKEPLQAKGTRIQGVPFAVEDSLEKDPQTTGRKCLDNFLDKGGTFHSVNPFSHDEKERIPFALLVNDEVRPSCSAGWCRSQILHAKLSKFAPHKITLLPPHAARYGFDPYNDQYNWDKEAPSDGFQAWAGTDKAIRIGFENLPEWEKIENNPTQENLKPIKDYYDQFYYADQQNLNRRVYITFAANVHVILKRLNETNDKLDNVVVVHLDLNDLIYVPYKDLLPACSKEAFEAFSLLLESALDLKNLNK